VWWLVSPQNPLKPIADMTPFAVRLEKAQRVAAGHKHIVVSDLENRLGGSHFTADTLKVLHLRFPRLRFVWLMGSDNLAQIRRWERWTQIFETTPIAVFDRPSYSLRALAGLAVRRFARRRLPISAARRLAETEPPAWAFFHTRLDPTSATGIRSGRSEPSPQTLREQRPELSTIATLIPRARKAQPSLPAQPAAPRELLELIQRTLEDGKAEDIVTIDLAGKTTIADQMVIASGRSARQVLALAEHLEETLSRRMRISVEGKVQAEWVLIDASDVIVHLFRPEVRASYNLEKLWGEALPDTEAVRQ
jgi:ribosome silencing factor RsfS/YbeB/iojap/nicotinate (nicotinamide) nucleotide adenylyltransferase